MRNRRILNDAQLIIGCVATGATALVAIRLLLGPHGGAVLRMKVARVAEDICMQNAQMWANAADIANNAYDNARAVTL